MSKKTNRFLAAMLTIMMLVSMIPAEFAVATVSEPWTLFPQIESSPQQDGNNAANDNEGSPTIVVTPSTPQAELAPGVINMVGFGYFKDAGSLAKDGYNLVKVDAQGNVVYENNEYTLFNGSQTMRTSGQPAQSGGDIVIDMGGDNSNNAPGGETGIPTPQADDRDIAIVVEPEQGSADTQTPAQAPTGNETAGRTAEISVVDDLATLNDRLGISTGRTQAIEATNEALHSRDLGLNRPFVPQPANPIENLPDSEAVVVDATGTGLRPIAGLDLAEDDVIVPASFTGCYAYWDGDEYNKTSDGKIIIYNQYGMVVGYWDPEALNTYDAAEGQSPILGSVVYFGSRNTDEDGVVTDNTELDRQQLTELTKIESAEGDYYQLQTRTDPVNKSEDNTLLYSADGELVAYKDVNNNVITDSALVGALVTALKPSPSQGAATKVITVSIANGSEIPEDTYTVTLSYVGSDNVPAPIEVVLRRNQGWKADVTVTKQNESGQLYDFKASGSPISKGGNNYVVAFANDGDTIVGTVSNLPQDEQFVTIQFRKLWINLGSKTPPAITLEIWCIPKFTPGIIATTAQPVYIELPANFTQGQWQEAMWKLPKTMEVTVKDPDTQTSTLETVEVDKYKLMREITTSDITFDLAGDIKNNHIWEDLTNGEVITLKNQVSRKVSVHKNWYDVPQDERKPITFVVQRRVVDASNGPEDNWETKVTHTLPVGTVDWSSDDLETGGVDSNGKAFSYEYRVVETLIDQKDATNPEATGFELPIVNTRSFMNYEIINQKRSNEVNVKINKVFEGKRYEGTFYVDVFGHTADGGSYQVDSVPFYPGDPLTKTISVEKELSAGKPYYKFTASDSIPGYNSLFVGYTWDVAHSTCTVELRNRENAQDLPGRKIWADGKTHTEKVTIHLLDIAGNTVATTEAVAPDYTFEFKGVRKYDDDGNPIQYRIVEELISGYIPVYDQANLTVTNYPDPAGTGAASVYGLKTWDDIGTGFIGTYPDVWVQLYVSSDGVTFEPDENSTKFKLQSQVAKTLLANADQTKYYKLVEVDESGNEVTSGTITGTDGNPYPYTAYQSNIIGPEDFKAGKVQVLTVSNILDDGNTANKKAEVYIRKVWDLAGLTGDQVAAYKAKQVAKFEVYYIDASGAEVIVPSTEINPAMLTWTGDGDVLISGLPAYRDGLLVNYLVREVDVPKGYAIADYQSYSKPGYFSYYFKNRLETTTGTYKKTWQFGSADQNGDPWTTPSKTNATPDRVTFKLLRGVVINGTVDWNSATQLDSATLLRGQIAQANWENALFSNFAVLPLTSPDGNETYEYKVVEELPPNAPFIYQATSKGGVNIYDPKHEQIKIEIIKKWITDGSEKLPGSVTLELWKNTQGETAVPTDRVETIKLTASNQTGINKWSVERVLPKYFAGSDEEIQYTLWETEIGGVGLDTDAQASGYYYTGVVEEPVGTYTATNYSKKKLADSYRQNFYVYKAWDYAAEEYPPVAFQIRFVPVRNADYLKDPQKYDDEAALQGGEETLTQADFDLAPTEFTVGGKTYWAWPAEFLDRLTRSSDGKVEYRVEATEIVPAGHTGFKVMDFDHFKAYNGFVAIWGNKKTEYFVDLNVVKAWPDDPENEFGLREDIKSITVSVADSTGENSWQPKELVKNSGVWSYTFEGLPKFTSDGAPCTFIVTAEVIIDEGGKLESYRYTTEYSEADLGPNGNINNPYFRYTVDTTGAKPTYHLTLNNWVNEKTDFVVKKKWSDENANNRPSTLALQVYRVSRNVKTGMETVEPYTVSAVNPVKSGSTWTWTYKDLPLYGHVGTGASRQYVKYSYYAIESSVPNGYTVSYDGTFGAGTEAIGVAYNDGTITNIQKKSGQKNWSGDSEVSTITRPSSIIMHLKRKTGTTVDQSFDLEFKVEQNTVTAIGSNYGKVTVDNNGAAWSWVFSNLDWYNGATLYTYYVEEEDVVGYSEGVSGMTATNTLATTSLSGTKNWNMTALNDFPGTAAQKPTHPTEIVIKLYRTFTTQADADNHVGGTQIAQYTKAVGAGATGNWTISSYPGNYAVAALQNQPLLTADADPDDEGKIKPCYYYAEEVELDGYTPSTGITKHDFVNTFLTTKIEGTKTFGDEGNKYGLRKDLKIQIKRNGANYLSPVTVLTAAQMNSGNGPYGWSIPGLPKVNPANGEDWVYTFEEVRMDGYLAPGYATGNAITNELDTLSLTITKNWNDETNKFQLRPENLAIKVTGKIGDSTVYPVGTDTGIQLIAKDANPSGTTTFSNLPRYGKNPNNGNIELITYTFEEGTMNGATFVAGVKGYTETEHTISTPATTDNYTGSTKNTPDIFDLPVTKKWVGDTTAIRDGVSLKLRLERKNKTTGSFENYPFKPYDEEEPVTKPTGGWVDGNVFTFVGLPRTAPDGTAYEYQVVEIPVAGYSSDSPRIATTPVTGTTATPVVVTNTGKLIDLTITKTWSDSDNAYDTRPSTLTFEIRRYKTAKTQTGGDESVGEFTVSVNKTATSKKYTKADTGAALLGGLPQTYSEGTPPTDNPYTYYIVEKDTVPSTLGGYTMGTVTPESPTTETRDFAVTNTLKAASPFTASKTWAGDTGDLGFLRPGTVTLTLERKFTDAPDTAFDTVTSGSPATPVTLTLSSADGWAPETVNGLPDYGFDAASQTWKQWVYRVVELPEHVDPNYGAVTLEGGTTVKNTLEVLPAGSPVTFTKVWPDGDTTSYRPAKITLTVTSINTPASGTIIRTVDLKPGAWTNTLAGLPVYLPPENPGDTLVPIQYQVTEEELNGYELEKIEISVNSAEATETDVFTLVGMPRIGVTVTNKLKLRSLSVTKEWMGEEGLAGETRPTSITLKLWRYLAGKTRTDKEAVPNYPDAISVPVNTDGSIDWTFTNLLEENAIGTKYIYYVEETRVGGYLEPEYAYTPTSTNEAADTTSIKITNKLDLRDLTGTKKWVIDLEAETAPTPPTSIQVIVKRRISGTDASFEPYPAPAVGPEPTPRIVTLGTDTPITWTINNLPRTAPTGTAYEYIAEEVVTPGYTGNNATDGNFVNTMEVTPFSGKKEFSDTDYAALTRPDSISLLLKRKVGTTVDSWEHSFMAVKANGYAYSFTKLRARNSSGALYEYYVTEPSIIAYDTTYSNVSGDARTDAAYKGGTVLNTLKRISFGVIKKWSDTNSGLRKDITVTLTATINNGVDGVNVFNGSNARTLTLNTTNATKVENGDTWTYTVPGFSNLPEYVLNTTSGEYDKIEYNLTETAPDNYQLNGITGPIKNATTGVWEFTATNAQKGENIEGIKTFDMSPINGEWEANVGQPKTIEITLWRYKKNAAGQPTSIAQKVPDGDLLGGMTNPLTVDIASGTGSWNFGMLATDAGNNETYEYYVTEAAIEGYTQTSQQGMSLVNQPDVISYKVIKKWNDNGTGFQFGGRPSQLKVTLTSNPNIFDGTEGKVITLTEGSKPNEWDATVTGLPKYTYDSEGNPVPIQYSVDEEDVLGFVEEAEETVTASNGNKTTTLNNKFMPISITVNKKWVVENVPGVVYPDSITIRLWRSVGNGTPDEVLPAKTINIENGDTFCTFPNLPRYEDNDVDKMYTYTVTEETIKGFSQDIDTTWTVDPKDGSKYSFEVRNTPDTIGLSGVKVWEDNKNEHLLRPDSVKINLWRKHYSSTAGDYVDDGTFNALGIYKDVSAATVVAGTDGTQWSWVFEGLPATDLNEKDYQYYVTETPVKGYNTEPGYPTIPGEGTVSEPFVVTNKQETVPLKVSKSWFGDDEKLIDFRPEFIEVTVTGTGLSSSKTYKYTIRVGQDHHGDPTWTATLNGTFPKYDKTGTLITYTVTETPLDAYKTEYTTIKAAATATEYTAFIRNTLKPTEVAVEKKWVEGDVGSKLRPTSIWAVLYDGDTVVNSVKLSATDNAWKHTFTGLSPYRVTKNSDGSRTYTSVTYSVKEYLTWDATTNTGTLIPGTYTQKITGGKDDNDLWAFVMENKLVTKDLTIFKAWNKKGVVTDWEDEIGFTVTGTSESGEVHTTTATLDPQVGEVTVSGLPVYDKNGKDFVYEVKEDAVPGYTDTYDWVTAKSGTDDMEITVTNTLETVAFRVEKTWTDDTDALKVRPASLKVKLLADGTSVKEVTLHSGNSWKDDFGTFPKYVKGKTTEITYKVEEEALKGYGITSADQLAKPTAGTDGKTVFKLDNTIKLTSLTINKEWLNEGNHINTYRPTTLKFNIVGTVGNTTVYPSTEVSMPITKAANKHSIKVSNLPIYDKAGAAITYTVTEATTNATKAYTPSIGKVTTASDGTMSVAVTNTLKTIKVGIIKKWTGLVSGVNVPDATISLNAGATAINTQDYGNNDQFSIDVPERDSSGNTINYTAVEDTAKLPTNFSHVSTEIESRTGFAKYFVVTNKYTPPAVIPPDGGTPPDDDPTTPPDETPVEPTPSPTPVPTPTPSPTPTTGGATLTPGPSEPTGGRTPSGGTPSNPVQRVEASEYFGDEDIPLSNGNGDHLHLGDCFD